MTMWKQNPLEQANSQPGGVFLCIGIGYAGESNAGGEVM
jgi:hypothetical protein